MSIHDYSKPSLTTDMVLFRANKKDSTSKRKIADMQLEVLLVKRTQEPQKGYLALPGGFVYIDEGIESNVIRQVKDKAGVQGIYYTEQLFTKGDIDRDPRGRVISVSYIGLGNAETLEIDGIKEEAEWYPLEEILEEELAFDHNIIIEKAVERLMNKVEYTDIAFNLLPKKFTISEVQQVYEMLLGKKILNFRRKINDYVEETGEVKEGKQFRPAALYQLINQKISRF